VARAREVDGLEAGDAFAVAARRIVAVRARELFEHAEDALDTEDIEQVHAARVATRRLRAVLEIFTGAFAPQAVGPVLDDVKALADALGARRDPDVQIERFSAMRAELGPAEQAGVELILAQLRDEQAAGNRVLAAALEQAHASDLPGRLQTLCEPVGA
jgi:CHAD domain-containing protein